MSVAAQRGSGTGEIRSRLNLLTVAAERNLTQLDEKLYFEVFAPDKGKPRRLSGRP